VPKEHELRYSVLLSLILPPLASCDVITPLTNVFGFQAFGAYTRTLAIYDTALFPGIGELKIQEIDFYSHGTPYGPFAAGETPINLSLGTTLVSSSDLRSKYSENISSGETLVFAGTLNPTPSEATEGFTIRLQLSSPFFYVPADGNLLLDIQNTGSGFIFPYDIGGAFPPHSVEGVNPVGSTNGFAPLIQLSGSIEPVPEPASIILLSVPMLLMVSFRNKRW
jgi:hypothetical protein